ncbi:hypothetical protein DMP11_08105 [Parvibacter caecicola]|nr:hypothetical protein DMP11_08105 [Parvibacter caecicola]
MDATKTVLLDTNALIAIEDPNAVLLEKYTEMLKRTNDFAFYIHPMQFEDIKRDKDERRKQILSSRVKRYRVLESTPHCDAAYFDGLGWTHGSENDVVDNNLLACVVNPYVDYLVTDDRRMHRKASQAGVEESVYTLDEFCEMADNSLKPPSLACVRNGTCSELDPDDAFFDSLRTDYPDFNSWLERRSREQRECSFIKEDGELRALCIYKHEGKRIIDDCGFEPEGDIVKFCTFKVDAKLQGSKIGERLFHQAFLVAAAWGASYVYFTVREDKQPQLVELALDFGFEKKGHYKGDRVIGKYIRPVLPEHLALEKLEYEQTLYPSYRDDVTVNKFLVPIQPHYHELLFPDIAAFSQGLFRDMPTMYEPESNTIRKAYLCKAPTNQIEPGDILLFYRSEDRQEVQAIGVAVGILRSNDVDLILSKVRNRSVYREAQIASMMAGSGGRLLTICFDLVRYLDSPVSLEKMKAMDLAVLRTIRRITDEQYRLILEAGQ